MSHDITRVNWAITTFLVSYSLIMTNEKQKEAKIACFYTADSNDHHMGCYNHNRLAVFFS